MSPPRGPTKADAENYLEKVKHTFENENHKFQEFLNIFRDFKSGEIDPATVYTRLRKVFKSRHPSLLDGFKPFLPEGFNTTKPTFKNLPSDNQSFSNIVHNDQPSANKQNECRYDGESQKHSHLGHTNQWKKSVKRQLENKVELGNSFEKAHSELLFCQNVAVRDKESEDTRQWRLPQKFVVHDYPENLPKGKLACNKRKRPAKLASSSEEEYLFLHQNLSVQDQEEDTCQQKLAQMFTPPDVLKNPTENKNTELAQDKFKDCLEENVGARHKIKRFAQLATSSEEEYSALFVRQNLAISDQELDDTSQKKLPCRIATRDRFKHYAQDKLKGHEKNFEGKLPLDHAKAVDLISKVAQRVHEDVSAIFGDILSIFQRNKGSPIDELNGQISIVLHGDVNLADEVLLFIKRHKISRRD